MKSEIRKEIVVSLNMTPKEASWLKAYLQNQIYEKESGEDGDMRCQIFDALPPFQDLYSSMTFDEKNK